MSDPKLDLVWVSLSASPAPSRLRRVRISEQARAVGTLVHGLWPSVEAALRAQGRSGFFLPLEDVLWPPSLVRALTELSPRVVHYHYHPDFWPSRSLLQGDFTRVTRQVSRWVPGVKQFVTLHAEPPVRHWGKERFGHLAGILRPDELKAEVRSVGPSVPGTVTRSPMPSAREANRYAVPSFGALDAVVQRLISLYF